MDISNLTFNCPRCITGSYFRENYQELATPEQIEYINMMLAHQRESIGRSADFPFPSFPALSRADNKTMVCNTCGQEEAMRNWGEPKKPLADPRLPDTMRVIDGSILMPREQTAHNPLPKGWIYRTGKDGIIVVSHPLNANLALTVLNPNHAGKSLAEQVEADTCSDHSKFLCSICFDLDEPRNGARYH
jgi:hypothetical protein